MSEHLTKSQLENYNQQKLSAAELLSISDHLNKCKACRHQVEASFDADATFFAVQSQIFSEAQEGVSPTLVQPHLTMEATTDYVDGTLSRDEMQVATDHLSGCDQCAVAVDDLRAFARQVGPTLNREYRPATIPTPTEQWSHRLAALIRRPFSRSPALVSAVAAVLLAGIGFVFFKRLQQGEPKPETSANITSSPSSTPAVVIAEVNDGERRLMLDQEGKLSGADDLPSDYQFMLKQALMRQRLEKSPLLAGLRRPISSLMSGNRQGSEFSVIEPVGKIVIADQPAFRWSRLNGAASYVVEIYDENFNRVVASSELTSTSWAPSQPLRRGGVYSWQVKAMKDGQEISSPRPPAQEARFRVLDQERTNEITQAQRAYLPSHLMLGLLYIHAGLLDEAEREFRTSQEANPNSPIVLQLLEDVQAMRR